MTIEFIRSINVKNSLPHKRQKKKNVIMFQSASRINHIKTISLLNFFPDIEEKKWSSDVTSVDGRRRLLTFFGLQVVFAAAVTLAACAFLAAGSASGDNGEVNYNNTNGRIVTVQKLFKPNHFSAADYND